jgi:hypothetical protein
VIEGKLDRRIQMIGRRHKMTLRKREDIGN